MTPNTECVNIFYQVSVQWGKILTSTLLKTTEFFLRQLLVRVVNDLLIRIVSRLPTKKSSVRLNPHNRTFENHRVFSRQLLVRVVKLNECYPSQIARTFPHDLKGSRRKPSVTRCWGNMRFSPHPNLQFPELKFHFWTANMKVVFLHTINCQSFPNLFHNNKAKERKMSISVIFRGVSHQEKISCVWTHVWEAC